MARYTRDGQKVKAVKSPLKNDEIIAEGQEVKKSNTPIGSPRRAAEELIEHTSLASGIAPLFPSPPSNHRDHVQPKGPKKHTTPRTPLPSKQTSKIARMDRNAFRTPSKEIEKSLDEAIDRKIEEDRKREFVWRG